MTDVSQEQDEEFLIEETSRYQSAPIEKLLQGKVYPDPEKHGFSSF